MAPKPQGISPEQLEQMAQGIDLHPDSPLPTQPESTPIEATTEPLAAEYREVPSLPMRIPLYLRVEQVAGRQEMYQTQIKELQAANALLVKLLRAALKDLALDDAELDEINLTEI